MAEPHCTNCGQPAQHEAESWLAWPGWRPYCCACFNHDWPTQQLIKGRECGKVLVVTEPMKIRHWEWREDG